MKAFVQKRKLFGKQLYMVTLPSNKNYDFEIYVSASFNDFLSNGMNTFSSLALK